MPKLFEIGKYVVFFWSNDKHEPIHVHLSVSKPSKSSAKVWITRKGSCIVAHNKCEIPHADLNRLLKAIQSNYFIILNEWKKHFNGNDITFYA